MAEDLSLLPSNASALERALALVDLRTDQIDADVVRRVIDPMRCPEPLLPWLAWAWSVDEYDPAWPEALRRGVIAASPELHRLKGTLRAVKMALAALGHEHISVEEWFDYGGEPFRFRVSLDLVGSAPITGPDQDLIVRTALKAKNVRSWLERLSIRRRHAVPAGRVCAFARSAQVARIGPVALRFIRRMPPAHLGAAVRSVGATRILPPLVHILRAAPARNRCAVGLISQQSVRILPAA
jgi:phage tail P2-like protein